MGFHPANFGLCSEWNNGSKTILLLLLLYSLCTWKLNTHHFKHVPHSHKYDLTKCANLRHSPRNLFDSSRNLCDSWQPLLMTAVENVADRHDTTSHESYLPNQQTTGVWTTRTILQSRGMHMYIISINWLYFQKTSITCSVVLLTEFVFS